MRRMAAMARLAFNRASALICAKEKGGWVERQRDIVGLVGRGGVEERRGWRKRVEKREMATRKGEAPRENK